MAGRRRSGVCGCNFWLSSGFVLSGRRECVDALLFVHRKKRTTLNLRAHSGLSPSGALHFRITLVTFERVPSPLPSLCTAYSEGEFAGWANVSSHHDRQIWLAPAG